MDKRQAGLVVTAIAKLLAVYAEIEGMKTANVIRCNNEMPMAYNKTDFMKKADEAVEIAKALETLL